MIKNLRTVIFPYLDLCTKDLIFETRNRYMNSYNSRNYWAIGSRPQSFELSDIGLTKNYRLPSSGFHNLVT